MRNCDRSVNRLISILSFRVLIDTLIPTEYFYLWRPRNESRYNTVVRAVHEVFLIIFQDGEGENKEDARPVKEEVVHDVDGRLVRDHVQEDCEEPGEGDHLDHAKLVESGVQIGDLVTYQVLQHTLVDLGTNK